MIIANKIHIKPTIFPDGTSQIWQLPEELLNAWEVNVTWLFESEREIFDLLSLRRLLYTNPMGLYIPYLPYARQDKEVNNNSSFNLEVLADLLNSMRLAFVESNDVHNVDKTKQLIKNFNNIYPEKAHAKIIKDTKADLVVFPDKGAFVRYHSSVDGLIDYLTLNKKRNQQTGKLEIEYLDKVNILKHKKKKNILIIDDLCDGGATFISAAKIFKSFTNAKIHLYVTHGIFSRGEKVLTDEGIILHYKHKLSNLKEIYV